jgi:hypothetical protein
METPPPAALSDIVDYLSREAPWELERFRSLDLLVASESHWADDRTQPLLESYTSWLRDMFSIFRSTASGAVTSARRDVTPTRRPTRPRLAGRPPLSDITAVRPLPGTA